jgi:hypothetical protein
LIYLYLYMHIYKYIYICIHTGVCDVLSAAIKEIFDTPLFNEFPLLNEY